MEEEIPPCTHIALETNPKLRQVLSELPGSTFAFAYGSGVFPQTGVNSRNRMLDLVIAVDNSEDWHGTNIKKNPGHYPWYMRLLGAKHVAAVQRSSFGARMYYNTIMPSAASSKHFKYGVISVHDLIQDLNSWKWLYVAGRTHKPVQILTSTPLSKGLANALEDNVEYATATALLTLSDKFAEEDVYTAAASLSYVGDVRMAVSAEVSSKVPSIVKANFSHFRSMYKRAINRLGCVKRSNSKLWERDLSPSGQKALLQRLPLHLQNEIKKYVGREDSTFGNLADQLSRKNAAFVSKAVVAAVGAIVAKSSVQQSLKGLITAGAGTSVRYVGKKLSKSLRSRLRNSIWIRTSHFSALRKKIWLPKGFGT